jgi:TonB family protein
MKKATLLFAFILIGSVALYASSDPVSAKVHAINMEEFVNKITYPIDSREQAVEGRVVILLNINETGEVVDNTIISADCPKLAAAVEKEIKNLEFTPAIDKNGNPIASTVKLPIDFELESN